MSKLPSLDQFLRENDVIPPPSQEEPEEEDLDEDFQTESCLPHEALWEEEECILCESMKSWRPEAIRHAPVITGEESKEVPEFGLTWHELQVLVGYWTEKQLAARYLDMECPASPLKDDFDPYAQRRLLKLEQILGPELIHEIRTEVAWDWRSQMGEEVWKIFVSFVPVWDTRASD